MELHERNAELTGQLQLTVAVFEASDIYYEDCLDDDDVTCLVDAISNFNRLCPAALHDAEFSRICLHLADFSLDNTDVYTDDHYVGFQRAFQPFIKLLMDYCNTMTEEDL